MVQRARGAHGGGRARRTVRGVNGPPERQNGNKSHEVGWNSEKWVQETDVDAGLAAQVDEGKDGDSTEAGGKGANVARRRWKRNLTGSARQDGPESGTGGVQVAYDASEGRHRGRRGKVHGKAMARHVPAVVLKVANVLGGEHVLLGGMRVNGANMPLERHDDMPVVGTGEKGDVGWLQRKALDKRVAVVALVLCGCVPSPRLSSGCVSARLAYSRLHGRIKMPGARGLANLCAVSREG